MGNPPPPGYYGTPQHPAVQPPNTHGAPALARLRQKVGLEASGTWVLVWFVAAILWMTSFVAIWLLGEMFGTWIPGTIDGVRPWGQLGLPSAMLVALIAMCSTILPSVLIVAAYRSYQAAYREVQAQIQSSDVTLMLVDESFGRMIEEWRRTKYRIALAEVPPGRDFASRFNHFAYNYSHYRALSEGRREFEVEPVSMLNCWIDGIAMCLFSGCVIIPLVVAIRVATLYPRVLAIKSATLDFLDGKWEPPPPSPYN